MDLLFDQAALLSVAADQHWQPRSVATVLSRPASWVAVEPAIAVFRAAFRKAPREMLAGWAYAALHGLSQASTPDHRYNNLVELTAATLGEDWTGPGHPAAFVTALTAITPNDADSIIHAALDRVWKRMKEAYATEDAITVFLHIISDLEEAHRQYAVRVVLST